MKAVPVDPSAKARGRILWRPVQGVLLLDKPPGPTSNGALQRVRRALGAAKGGHGGTLDPFASGLLPIALGEATKFLHDLLEADKTYEAVMRLGEVTDTGDTEGEVIAARPVQVDDATIEAACHAFEGTIDQIPPMYSALKRDGRALYDYARAGLAVERTARRVRIHAITVLDIDRSDARRPSVRVRVAVSKGTYLRALAQDIGERLGCGAHLIALRRLQVADLTLADACSLEALEALSPDDRLARLRPIDALVSRLPRIMLGAEHARRFLQGQRIILDGAERPQLPSTDAGTVRVYRDQCLLGTADFSPPGRIAPARVLAAASPAALPT